MGPNLRESCDDTGSYSKAPCPEASSSRKSGAHSRKFAEYEHAPSAGVEGMPSISDDLWRSDWKQALAVLKTTKGDDPLCDQLERIYPDLRELERLEIKLWDFYKLPGSLDSVALRQHCEESVRSEVSCSEDVRRQRRGWLQSLDRLHRLRKDRIEILTDLAEKYGSTLLRSQSPLQPNEASSQDTHQRPNMWAVLIGINKYEKISPLHGAVRDVEMMKEYLTSDLSVPENHIRTLTDAAATRTAILSVLYDLRDDEKIQRDDAILIHYSGHGASYDELKTVGSIEAICPVDRGVEDAHQGTILDISDREINLFLTELSRSKGDNVTLILDCCFSAGVTRGSNASTNNLVRSRGALPLANSLQRMLLATENNRRKHLTGISLLSPDWRPDVSSCVVLAACQDFERAWECNDGTGGDFTIALLRALRSHPLHTTTFVDLIERIGSLRRQRPCAVGNRIRDSVFRLGPGGPAPSSNIGRDHDVSHSTIGGLVRWFLTSLGY